MVQRAFVLLTRQGFSVQLNDSNCQFINCKGICSLILIDIVMLMF